MSFLIARPKDKVMETVDLFQKSGLQAHALALMDISVNKDDALIASLCNASPKCIIITSVYAVNWLAETISKHTLSIDFPTIDFVCVGASSAKKLRDLIDSHNIYIAKPENSEGILQLPLLQNITNKSIVLLKGEGGRNLIAPGLTERGGTVHVLDVYKRVANTDAIRGFVFEPKRIKCIISTSIEITELLLTELDLNQQNTLRSCIWIVASERIKDYAYTQGIRHILVSQGASNKALLNCANQLVKTGALHD